MNRMKRWRGVVGWALATFVAISSLAPIPASAHDAYFIRALVDSNAHLIQVSVQEDAQQTTFGFERPGKHLEAQLGSFYEGLFRGNEFPTLPSLKGKADENKESFKATSEAGDGKSGMAFTFPGVDLSAINGTHYPVNHGSQKDVDRAYTVKETLEPSLNDALLVLNGGKAYPSNEAMLKVAHSLTTGKPGSSVSINGYTVTFGARSAITKSKWLNGKRDASTGATDDDYVRIVKGKEDYEFIYRVPKGYTKKWPQSPVYDADLYATKWNSYVGRDVDYVSWHMLLYQAMQNYMVYGYTAQQNNVVHEPSAVEASLISLFQSLFDGLRNALGLYKTDELVFNKGIRDTPLYYYGVIPRAWEENIVFFHWIMQGFAWAVILFAIVKLLVQRTFATVNPIMRISLIEGLQQLLVSGILLAFIFPIVEMILYGNTLIVNIFKAGSANFKNFEMMGNNQGVLSGLILQFFYLVISLYLNFMYIMRAIVLSILMIMAPLFVASLSLGGKAKELLEKWLREFCAQVLMQAFHALLLTFFMMTISQTRGVEQLVVAFAMIPLTEFFRSLVLGPGGGITHELGMGSVTAGFGALSSMVRGVRAGSQQEHRALDQQEKEQKRTQGGPSLAGRSSVGTSSNGPNGSWNVSNTNKEIGVAAMKEATPDQLDMYRFQAPKAHSGLQSGAKQMAGALVSMANPSAVGNVALSVLEGTMAAGFMLAAGGSNAEAIKMGVGMMSGIGQPIGQYMANKGRAVSQAAGAIGKGIGDDRENAKSQKQQAPLPTSFQGPVSREGLGEFHEGKEPAVRTMPATFPAGMDAHYEESEMLTSHEYVQDMGNGQFQLHRSGEYMAEQGVVHAYTAKNGDVSYEYDLQTLNENDRSNVLHYADVYANGTQAQQQWLKANGVERVGYNPQTGNPVVTYNATGKQQLGVHSIQAVGEGNMKRFVETKEAQAPVASYKTVNVPKPTGQKDGHGREILQPSVTNPTVSPRPTQVVVNPRVPAAPSSSNPNPSPPRQP